MEGQACADPGVRTPIGASGILIVLGNITEMPQPMARDSCVSTIHISLDVIINIIRAIYNAWQELWEQGGGQRRHRSVPSSRGFIEY